MERLSRRELAVGGSVLLAASLLLSGCERTNPDGSNYYGSIQEIQDQVSDSKVAECLESTDYDMQTAKLVERENQGRYGKGGTNSLLEITPQDGGATLTLEVGFSSLARPETLRVSPHTDRGLLTEIGCDPTSLPKKSFIEYDVEKNEEKLARHHLLG